MNYLYLLALIVSLVAMLTIDRKFQLAFFHDAKRTALTLFAGMVLFILWDIAGILLDIFYSPGSAYTTGWYIAPHFPVEELFFLLFFSYFTLIVYLLGGRLWRRTSS